MGVICPACGTENRSIAKFCIECIEPLPAAFPATEIHPRPTDASAAASLSRAAVFAGPPAASPAAPSAAPAAAPRRIAEPRKGLWVSVAAFGIALAIGAAGWMVAGAGGLYIYSAAKPGKVIDVQAAPALPPAVPVADRSGALPWSNTEIITELASDVQPSTATPPGLAPAPRPPSATETVAPAPAPAPARAASSARPRPAAPPVAAPLRAPAVLLLPAPDAQCENLGFFARSRCMAAQCLKPENRAHAQCEAVRQQQQLMEEKRNPSGG